MFEVLRNYWQWIWSAFYGAWRITGEVVLALFLVGSLVSLLYPHKESFMQSLMWMIPLFVLVVFLFVCLVTAPHRMFKRLKKKIRVMLESINPSVLESVDKGDKAIDDVEVERSIQNELSKLSKEPNFDKFLSFSRGGKTIRRNADGTQTEINRYCFYPTGALRK